MLTSRPESLQRFFIVDTTNLVPKTHFAIRIDFAKASSITSVHVVRSVKNDITHMPMTPTA
jgi:hypothetical protein